MAGPRFAARPDDASPAPLVRPDADTLFRTYAREITDLALAILGSRHDAEDVAQEVFARAFRALPKLRDPTRVRTWLITIAIRRARTRLRQRSLARALFRAATQVDVDEITDPGASPEERAQIARLFRVLDRLPADLRIAWVLRHVHEEKMEAVAELCRCSLSTARRRLDQAHERVARRLGP